MRTLGIWLCAAALTLSLSGCGGGGPPAGPAKEAPDMGPPPGPVPAQEINKKK